MPPVDQWHTLKLQNDDISKLLSVIARIQGNMESVFPRLHPNFVTVCVSYSRLNGPLFIWANQRVWPRVQAAGQSFHMRWHSPLGWWPSPPGWWPSPLGGPHSIKTCNCSQSLREANKCAFHFGIIVLWSHRETLIHDNGGGSNNSIQYLLGTFFGQTRC